MLSTTPIGTTLFSSLKGMSTRILTRSLSTCNHQRFAQPTPSIQTTSATPNAMASVPKIDFKAINDQFANPELDSLSESIAKAWNDGEASNLSKISPHLRKILQETAQSAKVDGRDHLQAIPFDNIDMSAIIKRVIQMRTTVKVTKGGKVRTMSALVVVGNGKGCVGYGEGKDAEAPRAIMKAVQRALKNWVYIDRYDQRTIFHNLEHHFKATKIILRAERPGHGIRTNLHIHEICKCVGIQDIGGKVWGSRNPLNVVKGTIEALQMQRTPEEIACARGVKVMDVRKTFYGV